MRGDAHREGRQAGREVHGLQSRVQAALQGGSGELNVQVPHDAGHGSGDSEVQGLLHLAAVPGGPCCWHAVQRGVRGRGCVQGRLQKRLRPLRHRCVQLVEHLPKARQRSRTCTP